MRNQRFESVAFESPLQAAAGIQNRRCSLQRDSKRMSTAIFYKKFAVGYNGETQKIRNYDKKKEIIYPENLGPIQNSYGKK